MFTFASMMKKIVLGIIALLSIGNNTSFAQISANTDSIRFNPTSEIQLDSARLVIYNNSNSKVCVQEFKFFSRQFHRLIFQRNRNSWKINLQLAYF